MKTEIWIDYQDDDTPSTKWTGEVETGPIVVPSIGEKVGVRPIPELGPDAKERHLDYVVDVRHFFVETDGEWLQEVHVMTSSLP